MSRSGMRLARAPATRLSPGDVAPTTSRESYLAPTDDALRVHLELLAVRVVDDLWKQIVISACYEPARHGS
jgi:hypothetical protein